MKIGIVGGGQLAQMLCESAQKLSLKTVILAESASDCAVTYADEIIVGRPDDLDAVHNLFKQCDRVTFENDFLPYSQWANIDDRKTKPKLSILKKVSDKSLQRALAEHVGLATPKLFCEATDSLDYESLIEQHPEGFVVKWTKGGYDGKGVWIEPNAEERRATTKSHKECGSQSSPDERKKAFQSFTDAARSRTALLLVEERLSFTHELALVVARSAAGLMVNYPLVVSHQYQGICYRVVGPASHFGVNEAAELAAREGLKRLAEQLDYVGVLAGEFFWDGQTIFFNEMAPRVHNSAHYSQDTLSASQFENHMRAIADLPLIQPTPVAEGLFGMLNILGTTEPIVGIPARFAPSVGKFHWYSKTSRPGRKLGHINFYGIESNEKLDSYIRASEAEWRSFAYNRQIFTDS